jgi:hypothetical protein
VTLRARWVTLRARWVTLRACWVTLAESEMQRVRDRASNLIIAQTLGIRTLPWSGSGVERDVPAW